ncbi:MAG: TonB family protein [Planctomycetota bacterium]
MRRLCSIAAPFTPLIVKRAPRALLSVLVTMLAASCGTTEPPPSPPAALVEELYRTLATDPALLGVEPPRPIAAHCPAPAYDPPEGFTGELTTAVVLSIDEKGQVTRIEVAEPSMLAAYDEVVVRTLANWRFVPASRDGKPLSCRQRVRVPHVQSDG